MSLASGSMRRCSASFLYVSLATLGLGFGTQGVAQDEGVAQGEETEAPNREEASPEDLSDEESLDDSPDESFELDDDTPAPLRSRAVPTAGKPIKLVTEDCKGISDNRGLRDLPTILRSQYLLTGNVASDLMLRCDERTVDVGLRQDTVVERVKSNSYSSDATTSISSMETSFKAGGRKLRYGLQFEKVLAESETTTKATGAEDSKQKGTRDGNILRAETAGRFGDYSAGAAMNYVSQDIKNENAGAQSEGETLSLLQPVLSAAWLKGNSQVTFAYQQGVKKKTDKATLALSSVSTLRYVQVLEPDQGIRTHFEHVAKTEDNETDHYRALLGYFLMIDNVTVDVGWFGRTQSYKKESEAAASQLATFGFAVSTVWQFSPSTDFYGSLHSLSANESLGGTEKRTAHRLVTGGNLGLQVAF